MFAKNSRYRRLAEVVTVDEHGRSLPSKTLRLLPDVSGQFLHTIEDADRLDHLGYKYYRQPRKWWRVCDANPEFLSPQALLGKEPVVTDRIALEWDDEAGQPPWSAMLKTLAETAGVHDVQVEENWELIPGFVETEDGVTSIEVDYFTRAVVVKHNETVLSASELAEAIASSGFGVGQPQREGRVGKQIVVPPDVV